MSKPQQQVFRLVDDQARNFENFYAGLNTQCVVFLQRWLSGLEDESHVVLVGPAGSGRTHLLQACCQQVSQAGQLAYWVPLNQSHILAPDILEGLENGALICLDDIEAICGQPAWEEAIFHLHNRALAHECRLLYSVERSPKQQTFSLADLQSRLCAGLVLTLAVLSDEEKQIALQQHAAGRGLNLTHQVTQYMLTHIGRDLPTLMACLDQLDAASMAQERRLTIPLLQSIRKDVI